MSQHAEDDAIETRKGMRWRKCPSCREEAALPDSWPDDVAEVDRLLVAECRRYDRKDER